MHKRAVLSAAILAAAAVSGCTGGGGGVYAAGDFGPGPYAYDGFYDDYYGSIYDGYWGDDDFFYYRHGIGDRRFHRGDAAHFQRSGAHGGHFHPMQGSMTPQHGMHMPHFGGGRGGPGRGGHR